MIYRHRVLPSTMLEAARLASEGAPAGTVVLAGEQTAGQGRHGRLWHSAPGEGLYLTAILRVPELKPAITLALGVAVADAISELTSILPDLRWPNDVMIGDRKLAGILTQYEHGAVLAGIGINVNQREFPPEIRDLATSLYIESGRTYSTEDLLQVILRRIEHISPDNAIPEFTRRSSYARGRRARVDLDDEVVYGTTAGLNEAGFLLLDKDTGERITILAGGVRPA